MCAPMPELSGNVLLLEDNLIVSLDVEEILKELGAQNVYSADTVKDALGLVDAHSYSFALLDVKLSDGSTPRLPENTRGGKNLGKFIRKFNLVGRVR